MSGPDGSYDPATVLRNLKGPIYIVENDSIAYGNDRFFEISHLAPAAVPGAPRAELERLMQEDFPAFLEAYEAVSARETDEVRLEVTMFHPETAPVPEQLPVEARLTPIDEGGDGTGVLVALRNISQRKQHERELERQNERMAKVVNVVSHDLRNPLNVAEGRLALARDECESEHFEPVARALARMQTLIDDLLTLAREGAEVDEFDRIALAEAARQSWATVETGDATLVTETDRAIAAARSRLQQLLENLFRNAIDHGGPAVTVTVGELADGAGFYVADDGTGIPPDEREQVLESGFSTSDEGTGFGLSIVQEIAEAHGWTISLTESEEGGLRVEITGVEFVE